MVGAKTIPRTQLKFEGGYDGILVLLQTTQEVWRRLVTFPPNCKIPLMDGVRPR